MRQLVIGLLFALLWASAAVATKFGIHAADPLILANVRFFLAGGGMLLYAYLIRKGQHALPKGKEWLYLTIFGCLNTTVYLGCFVIAMKTVSAGIGSLATATNPLFIMVISALWLKRPLKWYEIAGMLLGMAGVAMATWPLLQDSHATVGGIVILMLGMFSVSVATVYYARINFGLSSLVINGWQVFLGGLLFIPITALFANFETTHFNAQFWLSVGWLILPVSVVALQLWFYLVRKDAVRASLWLFLCPVFGFLYSWMLLDEPITWYTFAGTILVIGGLYLAQREKFRKQSTIPQNQ
ncbi:DMT family transporter [Chitinophaga sp. CF418]|uniref:DMT family transporter n=1 Tax=Chitinophaga sp. CF418 TaxID=1855287 RepID=UPI00091FF774|nr:EamA family transporter [Chitinophaga sp. CF418]SHM99394.1 Permease of the drug/metabolite transporter (DMT) superfamily [Chitinophaga sp. CF418]